ncbi:DUF3263 domain-containing protein [Microbacterium sp. NPDC008134]|uniref:DUF3263 domain-containing protein n=1 Tax=Microbacterium sp. NPDC008134 TaxID=3364183 RepID=UPI0036E7380E
MTPSDLLAFEAAHPAHTPTKTSAIQHELGLHPARYYQLLNRAASSAAGIAADPLTARRVRERPVQATRRHVCTSVCHPAQVAR